MRSYTPGSALCRSWWGSKETGKGCIGEVVPRGPPIAGLGRGSQEPGNDRDADGKGLLPRNLTGGGTASPPGDPRPYYDALVSRFEAPDRQETKAVEEDS